MAVGNSGLTRITLSFLLSMLRDNQFQGPDAPVINKHHWSYKGPEGPDSWHLHYSQCGGRRQSPVDIPTAQCEYDPELSPFILDHFDSVSGLTGDYVLNVTNNGHAASVSVRHDGMCVRGGGLKGSYKTAEFHFHWGGANDRGSEHALDLRKFPLEMHVVNFNEKYGTIKEAMTKPDGLAVLGVFFELSDKDNPHFAALGNSLRSVHKAGEHNLVDQLRLRYLLPQDVSKYWRYDGSLTTPYCFESVTWTLFEEPQKISDSQLSFLRNLLHEDGHDDSPDVSHHTNTPSRLVDNWRPLQPLEGRVVKRSFKLPGDMGAMVAPRLSEPPTKVNKLDPVNTPSVSLRTGNSFAVSSSAVDRNANTGALSAIQAAALNKTLISTSIALANTQSAPGLTASRSESSLPPSPAVTNAMLSQEAQPNNLLPNNAQHQEFPQRQATAKEQAKPEQKLPSLIAQTNSPATGVSVVNAEVLHDQKNHNPVVTNTLEYLTSGASGVALPSSNTSPRVSNLQTTQQQENRPNVKAQPLPLLAPEQSAVKKSQLLTAATQQQQQIYHQRQSQQLQRAIPPSSPALLQQIPQQQQNEQWERLQALQQFSKPLTTPRPRLVSSQQQSILALQPNSQYSLLRTSQQALQEFLRRQEQEQRRLQWQLREFRVHRPSQHQRLQTQYQQQEPLGKDLYGTQNINDNKMNRNVLFSRSPVHLQKQMSQPQLQLYSQALTNVPRQEHQRQKIIHQQRQLQQKQLQQLQQQQLRRQQQQQLQKLKIQQQQQQQQQQTTSNTLPPSNVLRNILQKLTISNHVNQPNTLTSGSARINTLNGNGLYMNDMIASGPVYSAAPQAPKRTNHNGIASGARMGKPELGVRSPSAQGFPNDAVRTQMVSRQVGPLLRNTVRPTAMPSGPTQYQLRAQPGTRDQQSFYPTLQQQAQTAEQGQSAFSARHPGFGEISASAAAVGSPPPRIVDTKLGTLGTNRQQSVNSKMGSSSATSLYASDENMPRVFLHRIHQPVRIRRPFYEKLYNWRHPQF